MVRSPLTRLTARTGSDKSYNQILVLCGNRGTDGTIPRLAAVG